MMRTMFHLAWRSLARNKRRSAFTVSAIVFGVAVVIFAHGFGAGLLRVLADQTLRTRTGAVQVHKKGYLDATEAMPLKLDMPDTPALRAAIAGVPGVVGVAPRIRFGGLVSNGRVSSMVMGGGFDPVLELQVCDLRSTSVLPGNGAWLASSAPRGGVVGAELGRSFAVKPGGSLTLQAAGRDGGLNALDVDVVGSTSGAALFESKRILEVPLAFAQELLQMPGRVTEYAVAVDDLDHVADVVANLQSKLGPDYEVSPWQDVVPFLRDAILRLTVVLTGISVVLFVIVIFGVVNTMLMSVYERTREIGTMLAVGWRRTRVLQLFLLEAFMLGLVGGVAGAIIGVAVTTWVGAQGITFSAPGSDLVQVLRPVVKPGIVGIALLASSVGALLASWWPARRASLLDPVEALRTL